MQSHIDLLMLADLHQEALLIEAERRRVEPIGSTSDPGLRTWLASMLVGVALLLDQQAVSAGVEAALGRPRRLPGHV
jgi:hypothetical protein